MRFWRLLLLGLMFTAQAEAAGVAVVAPKDGDEARFGLQLSEGVKIAVEVINESGGLLGEKLEILDIDDVCSNSFVFGLSHKLHTGKDSGINLVVGPYCAERKAIEGLKDGTTVRILPQALANSLYNYDREGLFKIGGRISEQAKTVFEVYKQNWAGKSIAVVYDKENPASYEAAADIQSIFMANDLTNRVTLYDFGAYENKYKKMAKEIIKSNKIAYILGDKKQIADLAGKLQEKDENITLIIDEYMATDYFFKEMGNFANGVYVLRLNNQKSNAAFTKELVGLRIKNKEPHGLGVMGYAAVMMWSNMVKKAGSFDAGVIDKVAMGQEWSLPWGKVGFQHGRALSNSGWNMYIYENGEYTQVN